MPRRSRSTALARTAPTRLAVSRGTLDVVAILRAGAWRGCEELPDKVLRTIAATAQNTRRWRRAGYRVWQHWCAARAQDNTDELVAPYPATPASIAEFLQDHAPPILVRADGEFEVLAAERSARGTPVKTLSTLTSYLATLSQLHRAGGHPDPTKDPEVQAVWRVLRRALARPKQKTAMSWEFIREALEKLPDTLQGKRDRALLVIGYACMARRSELVALNVEHFTREADGGASVTFRRIKTNTDWTGYLPPPVFAVLEAWLQAAGIRSGAIFRRLDFYGKGSPARMSAQSVALVYKRAARLLGVDPSEISSHSARIGATNDLVEDGAPDAAIMRDAGWTTPRMVGLYGRGAKAKQGAMARRLGRVG